MSGIALNHQNDWNPNYIVSVDNFHFEQKIAQNATKDDISKWLEKNNFTQKYKTHYFLDDQTVKIYLTNSTIIELKTNTGDARVETLKRRPIFYQSNYLHYNPNKWWTIFSDAFAGTLILFAITGLIMVRGKKGLIGRGGIYVAIGILIPLLILFFS